MQPTPRWDLNADTVVLNIDHYTLLQQAVLQVKGVPLFYLPVLYYPTKEEDRATGFLLPTYGASTLRGQSHSQRVLLGDQSQPGRDDRARLVLEDRPGRGQRVPLQLRRRLDGNLTGVRARPAGDDRTTRRRRRAVAGDRAATRSAAAPTSCCRVDLRARASVELLLEHRHDRRRSTPTSTTPRATSASFGGNVVGAWGSYSLNGTFDRSEYFYNHDQLGRQRQLAAHRRSAGTSGRCSELAAVLLGQQRVRARPARSADGRRRRASTPSLSRLDFSPQIRYPFKKWQWFTVNSTVELARHLLHAQLRRRPTIRPVRPSTIVDEGLNRQYFTFQAQIVGPVFNRDLGHAGQRLRGEVQARVCLRIPSGWHAPNYAAGGSPPQQLAGAMQLIFSWKSSY